MTSGDVRSSWKKLGTDVSTQARGLIMVTSYHSHCPVESRLPQLPISQPHASRLGLAVHLRDVPVPGVTDRITSEFRIRRSCIFGLTAARFAASNVPGLSAPTNLQRHRDGTVGGTGKIAGNDLSLVDMTSQPVYRKTMLTKSIRTRCDCFAALHLDFGVRVQHSGHNQKCGQN